MDLVQFTASTLVKGSFGDIKKGETAPLNGDFARMLERQGLGKIVDSDAPAQEIIAPVLEDVTPALEAFEQKIEEYEQKLEEAKAEISGKGLGHV
jgi:hypothetical protein